MMNRLLVISVLGVVSFAAPQPVTAQSVQGGIKGGLSLADIPRLADQFEEEGAVDLRYRSGLIVGGFATIQLAEFVAFQPEVLYAQKGMHGRDPAGVDDVFETRVDYLDVPLLLRLQDTALYVVLGPSLNFNVAAKLVDEGDDVDQDIKDDTETVEVGVVVGVGLQMSRFLVEGRFAEGLTNIAKNPPPGQDSYRNRSFAIMFGIRFP
jgi:Outer membrane protein beta-barrel domain